MIEPKELSIIDDDTAIEDLIEDDDAALEMEADFDGEVIRGIDGVSVASVEQTTESTDDGGMNEITVTLSDGKQSKIRIRNGSKGIQGKQGIQGIQGEKGADGHTPEKGIDYYTEADKTEIVDRVLAALPNGDEVSY